MPLVMDTRPAAYALIIEDGRILLSHWVGSPANNASGGWTLPGGGMDPGEQPEQSAIREVFEETGYRVEVDRLLGVHTMYYSPEAGPEAPVRPFCAFRTIYTARVTSGTLTYEVGGSTDRAAWVPLAELPSLPLLSLVDEAARMLGYQDATDLAQRYPREGAHA